MFNGRNLGISSRGWSQLDNLYKTKNMKVQITRIKEGNSIRTIKRISELNDIPKIIVDYFEGNKTIKTIGKGEKISKIEMPQVILPNRLHLQNFDDIVQKSMNR